MWFVSNPPGWDLYHRFLCNPWWSEQLYLVGSARSAWTTHVNRTYMYRDQLVNSSAQGGLHDLKDLYDLQDLYSVDVSPFGAMISTWSLWSHLRAGWDDLNAMCAWCEGSAQSEGSIIYTLPTGLPGETCMFRIICTCVPGEIWLISIISTC